MVRIGRADLAICCPLLTSAEPRASLATSSGQGTATNRRASKNCCAALTASMDQAVAPKVFEAYLGDGGGGGGSGGGGGGGGGEVTWGVPRATFWRSYQVWWNTRAQLHPAKRKARGQQTRGNLPKWPKLRGKTLAACPIPQGRTTALRCGKRKVAHANTRPRAAMPSLACAHPCAPVHARPCALGHGTWLVCPRRTSAAADLTRSRQESLH